MRRGWKIAIGVILVLIVALGLNALAVDGETKSAEVTVPDGRILTVAGREMQVVEGGPRGGSPIVLIHCYTCAIDWWDGMRPALEREHRVIAIDLLGFGGSEKPGAGYSIESQSSLVAAALARLGVRKATVVGHSLGGSVVGALAEESPGLVGRAVIIDQAPDNEDFEREGLPFSAKLTFVPVIGPALWRVVPDFEIKDGLGAAFAPGYDVPDAFVDDFRRQTYTSYDSAAAAEDDFLNAIPLDERIRRAGIPLLAIFGADERLYEPRKALAAYGKIPGAATALVPGAGHSPNVEKPAKTAALVLAFAPQAPVSRHQVQNALQNQKRVRPRP